MAYAPFDYINPNAKLVIVGLTPGLHQAQVALRAASQAINRGHSESKALLNAKASASFAGPMRANLIRLLDSIGLADNLGLHSTSELWAEASDLCQFTSLVRYPVFVDGKNWSGQPNLLRSGTVMGWVERFTGDELSRYEDAVIIPLGPRVSEGLKALSDAGLISRDRILFGVPHPSGANAERIACFLGNKDPADASEKTNGIALLAARQSLTEQVTALRTATKVAHIHDA